MQSIRGFLLVTFLPCRTALNRLHRPRWLTAKPILADPQFLDLLFRSVSLDSGSGSGNEPDTPISSRIFTTCDMDESMSPWLDSVAFAILP